MSASPTDRGTSANKTIAGDQSGTDEATVHPGDSAVQRNAEPLMIAAVAKHIEEPLTKRVVPLPGGARPEVDGVSEDGRVLVEAFAHQGKMIGAQLKKVSEDVLKLITLAKDRQGTRLIVAFADDEAAKSFLGKSWKAESLRMWDVEVLHRRVGWRRPVWHPRCPGPPVPLKAW